MKQITRWSPDTCDCVLEYEWDDSVPEKDRVHTPVRFVQVCEAHKDLAELNGKYNQVKNENQTKNKVLGELLNNVSEIRKEVPGQGSEVNYELKEGVDYKFSFDKDRKLEFELTGVALSPAKKLEIQTLIQQKFPNKAKLKEF